MNPGCSKKNSTKKIEQTINFLKTVSDRNRLQILCLLKDKERCVCEIWQWLDLPQNLVSHHLKVLRELELVSSRKEGVKIYYKLNQKVVNKYLKVLNKLLNSKSKYDN